MKADRNKRQSTRISIILIGCALLLAACTTGRVQAKSTSGLDIAAVDEVVIENFAGSIEIVTGATGRLDATITKFAPAGQDERLAALDFTLSADNNRVLAVGAWGDGAQPEPGVGIDLKLTAPSSATLTVINGNGSIRYAGLPGGARLSFSTGNGDIALMLPTATTFRVKAQTANGNIDTNYPLAPSRTATGATLDGMMGADPVLTIEATTGSGNITLERKP